MAVLIVLYLLTQRGYYACHAFDREFEALLQGLKFLVKGSLLAGKIVNRLLLSLILGDQRCYSFSQSVNLLSKLIDNLSLCGLRCFLSEYFDVELIYD